MSYKDTTQMALNGEYLAALLDEYLDWIIEHNHLNKPSESQIEEMRNKVIKKLQEKYPDAGIVLTKK